MNDPPRLAVLCYCIKKLCYFSKIFTNLDNSFLATTQRRNEAEILSTNFTNLKIYYKIICENQCNPCHSRSINYFASSRRCLPGSDGREIFTNGSNW
jgi:hypothetical protein